jgi:hypothetical protein
MRFDNLNGLGTHSRQFHKEVIETEPEESEKA